MGTVRRPACRFCSTYWFLSVKFVAPAGASELTTYRRLPSADTLTELGYHPVGMRPIRARPSPSGSSSSPSGTTATELVAPMVTNSRLSWGASARVFGWQPENRCYQFVYLY